MRHLRSQQHDGGEDHARHDAHGGKAIAQQLAVPLPVLFSVVEAHQRLTALGDTQHGVDHQRVDIGDDGVTDQPIVPQTPEDDAVEQKDHHTVAQLRHAVSDANGDQPLVDVPIHTEPHRMEGGLSPQEVAQIDDAGQQLGSAGGHRRAPYAPVQHKDGRIVQYAVGQAACYNGDDGQPGIAVGFDEHLQIVGDDKANGEGGQPPQIVDGIGKRDALGAQQPGKGLQKDQHQRCDHKACHRQQHQILGKQAVGLFALAAAQIDGDDGAGTHSKDDGDGEQHVGEGHRQIYRGHGVFAHTLGNKQAVHDGIQGKYHQG